MGTHSKAIVYLHRETVMENSAISGLIMYGIVSNKRRWRAHDLFKAL